MWKTKLNCKNIVFWRINRYLLATLVSAPLLSKFTKCSFSWRESKYPSGLVSSNTDGVSPNENVVASFLFIRNVITSGHNPLPPTLRPLWPRLNAGTPGHVLCLSHSSGVLPRRARRLGTALTGNFPQVVSGRGTQAYLCLCPRSASFSADPALSQAHTHLLYLPSHTHRDTHTANSDIKPGSRCWHFNSVPYFLITLSSCI